MEVTTQSSFLLIYVEASKLTLPTVTIVFKLFILPKFNIVQASHRVIYIPNLPIQVKC